MTEPAKAPGLVNWTGYLSLAMLLILPVAVIAARSGAWQPGLLLYAVAIGGERSDWLKNAREKGLRGEGFFLATICGWHGAAPAGEEK